MIIAAKASSRGRDLEKSTQLLAHSLATLRFFPELN